MTCMFYKASLPETDTEEDHRDVVWMISSNGQEHRLQTVFNVQRTEVHEVGEPWVHVGEL